MDDPATNKVGRRRFLKQAGLVSAALPLAGGAIAAACSNDDGKKSTTSSPAETRPPGSGNTTPASQQGKDDWRKIDEDHKKGVELFLKNTKEPITKGKGGTLLPFTMEGDVKVFNLTVDEVEWETIPGETEKARGYNNQIVGPTIRVTEGDKIKINVKNNLTESTAVHWHGSLLPNDQDGVPFVTQDPIEPGKTFTYQFSIRNSGTHMYHAHHNSMDQVNRGLLGAFIVDPKDKSTYPAYDKEYILVLNDTLLGFTINGKGFPATDALVAKKGEKVLVRWMNEGLMNHPMHLHGMPMKVIAIDGYNLASPYMCDTIDVAPGNRYDTLIDCTEPGLWAFHCHVLSHAESPAGFFGLVTVLVVQE